MLNRVNGKLFKVVGVLMALVLVIIIVMMIFGGNKVLSFSKIEDRMVSAAMDYYEDNEQLLPQENGGKSTVSGLELETGYMPNISRMVADGVVCNGEVRVYKFNNQISYSPYLNCGEDYVTKELYKEISKTENIVTASSGLYKMGDEYVYRGFDVNNYVEFAGRLWRIIKVDGQGNVKIIDNETKIKEVWDDSYNPEKSGDFGFNVFYNEKTEPSKLYTFMLSLLEDEEYIQPSDLSKLTYVNVCYGSRSLTLTAKDGAAECALKVSSPVGLISVNEYLRASLDENCKTTESNSCVNYNYLSDFSGSYWTSTPVSSTTYRVYKINDTVSEANASASNAVRTVLNLNSSVVYASGDGSLNNPYKIK